MKRLVIIFIGVVITIGLVAQSTKVSRLTEDTGFEKTDIFYSIDQGVTSKKMTGETMLIPLTDTADILRIMIGDSTSQLRSEIGGEGTWSRSAEYSFIYPTQVTDKVIIGSQGFDDYSMDFTVVGSGLFTGNLHFTNASDYVCIGTSGMYDGHLTFKDVYNRSTTLSDLLNQESYWDLSGTELSPASDNYTLNIGGGLGSSGTYSFQVQGGSVLFYEDLQLNGRLELGGQLFFGALSSPEINYIGGLYHSSVDSTLKFYNTSWRTFMMSGDNDGYNFGADTTYTDVFQVGNTDGQREYITSRGVNNVVFTSDGEPDGLKFNWGNNYSTITDTETNYGIVFGDNAAIGEGLTSTYFVWDAPYIRTSTDTMATIDTVRQLVSANSGSLPMSGTPAADYVVYMKDGDSLTTSSAFTYNGSSLTIEGDAFDYDFNSSKFRTNGTKKSITIGNQNNQGHSNTIWIGEGSSTNNVTRENAVIIGSLTMGAAPITGSVVIGSNIKPTVASSDVDNSVVIGDDALSDSGSIDKSVFIGRNAGGNAASLTTRTGNVFIGYNAGNDDTYATANDQLIIENSNAGREGALIWGDFDKDSLQLNAWVKVRRLSLYNASASDIYIDGYHIIRMYEGSLTDDAPILPEIASIIGSPVDVPEDVIFEILDTDGTGKIYEVYSDGTDWYYLPGRAPTKAEEESPL